MGSLKEKAKALLQQCEVVTLTSINKEGYPRPVPLSKIKTEGLTTIWFVPGDEDGGGLTSFVVFSSIGFYPVTPGFPSYNIGSPLFSNVKVTLPNGRIFEIDAENCSDENKYIQSATLNGKPLDQPWFTHDDIKNGGKLVLVMGRHPNKAWGADKKAAPPSADIEK